MFYDSTKRPIQDSEEFAVAIDNIICHGLAMDPVNYDLKPEKDEDLLVIETFNFFAKPGTDPLSQQVFRCKKGEEKILPNVLIIDENIIKQKINVCRTTDKQEV